MRDLFERIHETEDKYETHIELSMIELYKECIRDLLSDNFPEMPTGGLKLLENEKDRVTIADVSILKPKSADEVMELVLKGNERRSTSFTTANSASSRSHAVLQISIARKSRNADVNMEQEAVYLDTSFATLSIVDLAGSERASATRNMGERMKEGAKINQSLLALSSCISALCDAQRKGARPHVPYRNSKLTRLLKFSLGGNCRTVMIVCVSPSSKDIEDTSNTLTWADRAKHVKTTVTRNINGTHVSARQYLEKIQQLSERITLLEAQLNQKDQETSKLVQLKIDDAKKQIADYTRTINQQVEEASETIREGAEYWAKWDVARLGIEKLENRRNDLDADLDTQELAKETALCNSLIDHYKHAYTDSRALQVKVNKGNDAAVAIGKQIDDIESRTFSDLDPVYAQNLRLEMALCRDKIKLANAKGCEVGYRERLAKHEDALARSAIAASRLESIYALHMSHIESLCAQGPVDPSVLRERMKLLSTVQKPIFDDLSNIHQHMQLSDAPAPPPVPTPIKGAQLRHNASPITVTSPKSKRLSQRLSYGLADKKHVVGKPASPRRSLPGRTSIRRASGLSAPPRSARFADEAGGDLVEIRQFKARSSQSPTTEMSTDDSAEWEEVQEPVVKPAGPSKPKAATIPLKPQRSAPALRAMGPPAVPAGPSVPAAPRPSASTSSAAPSSDVSLPSTAAAPEIPAWKANRLGLGKYEKERAPSPPKGDVSISSAASETSFSKVHIPIGLGRPSRPPPSRPTSVLGELRQLPPSRPASSLGSSTLHLPTASSAARSNGSNGDKSPLTVSYSPSVSSPNRSVSRRLSDRYQRKKLHQGAVPYKRKASMIPSPSGSPSGASPRGSTIGLTKSIGPGTGGTTKFRNSMVFGQSVSAGTTGAGLRTKTSATLIGGGSGGDSGSGAGAGAGAAKPVWR